MGGGLAANDIPMKDYFFIYFPLHSMSFYSVRMNIFMSDQWMDYIFSILLYPTLSVHAWLQQEHS